MKLAGLGSPHVRPNGGLVPGHHYLYRSTGLLTACLKFFPRSITWPSFLRKIRCTRTAIPQPVPNTNTGYIHKTTYETPSPQAPECVCIDNKCLRIRETNENHWMPLVSGHYGEDDDAV